MPKRPDPDKARLWQQRFRRFHQAGLSVSDFCSQEGVSVATFYFWKRRCDSDATTLSSPAAPATTDFVPIRLVPSSPTLELLLPCGALLRIGPDSDAALLHQVFSLLGVASC